jgi:hypothetical protein
MAEQPTCGQGLADHSALPRKLGELTDAVADVLERHETALDSADENARREHAAYERLVIQHRDTAARLRQTAEEMAGYRDLPMGRHDPAALSAPAAAEAFETFVRLEQEVALLLEQRLDRDRAMLEGMGRPV